ncbi:MAG: hypothetical protein ABI596_15185 [Pyrinomonadaceae bacterium]
MKTKYYKYTLQGEYSHDDALRKLGEAATEGYVVRIDNERGQTHIYLASSADKKTAQGLARKEVSEGDVTKLF